MYHALVQNILTTDECLELISRSEKIGFQKADVRFYKGTKKMENVRNNSRIEFTDDVLLQSIQDRLISSMLDSFPFQFLNHKLNKDVSFTHLNPTLRFYKYLPGQYFKPHKDGGYQAANKESLITLLLYLNDTDEGFTVLMPDGPSHPESFINIHPRAGDVLLFQHNTWHEGKPVNTGSKYVLRSDLFYTTS